MEKPLWADCLGFGSNLLGLGEDAEVESGEMFVIGGENSCYADVFGKNAGCGIG